MKRISLWVSLLAALVGFVFAEDKPITLSDIRGKQHTPLALEKQKASVLIFISRDCPISNAFIPEINRIVAEYQSEFAFWLIHSDPTLPTVDARKHAELFDIQATILLDPEQKLAKLTGAKVTPEAAVLNEAGKVLYLGRINDLYAALTKKRPQPTTRDLRDALDALRSGNPLPSRGEKAIGCGIEGR